MGQRNDLRAGLIGRDGELAELDQFLAEPGHRGLVIRGEAGIGKSAMTDVLRADALRDGWRLLSATAVEAEQAFALSGLNQVVFGLRDDLAGLDGRQRDVLAPVFGAETVQSPSPIALTVALLGLLSRVAHERPILLLVEDAHWLDELSAVVLGAAGRRVSDPRLRIVVTVRPHAGVEFPAGGWAEMELRPLSPTDAMRLVDGLGMPLTAAARRAVLDAAEGNPLALQELPRSAGHVDSFTMSMPLTERLVRVFGSRLRRLDSTVRTQLLRGALDGAPATAWSDSGSRYSMTDVASAIDLDLLTVGPSGEPMFRHPLVRAAVIQQASAAERRAAHAHLSGLYPDVLARKATHLSGATARPDQAVADLLEEAARQSIRRGGAAVAVDWLRRAAELSTDVTRRELLRAEAAFVASQAGRLDDVQSLVHQIDDDAESAAAVLTGAYLALYRDGDVADSHRRIIRVLLNADHLDDAAVVRLVNVLLAVTLYSGDQRHWQQTDALVDRLATRLDGDSLLYRDAWGDVVRRGRTVRARLANERTRFPTLEPWDAMRLGVTAYYVDGLAEYRPILTKLFERERDRGAVTNAMTMLHLLLLDQIRSGAWDQARESLQTGLQLSQTHHNDLFRYQFTAYDGLRAASAGDVDTARRCASEVAVWARPRRVGLLLEFVQRIATLTALGNGEYADAYTACSNNPAGEGFPPYSHVSTDALLDLVEAAVHSGHLEEARTRAAEAVRLGVAEISPRLAALVDAVQAMTVPDADADPFYQSALGSAALADFPFEHNRIRLGYGMWLRRQRRTAEARDMLTLATDGFAALGAQPWEERARNELRATGAAVKRAASDAVTLTAQERTIAELAAVGKSNKQIAAQLYLSPRTVGAHLYRIFPKLGITSRAALGQALRQLDA